MSDLAEVVELLGAARSRGVRVASEPLGKSLLAAAGVAVPAGVVVRPGDDVATAAAGVRTPAMVKIALDDTPHKSDVGGVVGPVDGADAVAAAVADLRARFDGDVLVEECVPGGVECFVGLTLTGPYGSVITVGLGGIWVEVLRDVQHRRAPVNVPEAREMLAALRAAPALTGGRGRTPVDLDALAEAIVAVSRLAADPALRAVATEVEINPLSALPDAVVALDCVVTLRPDGPDRSTEGERR